MAGPTVIATEFGFYISASAGTGNVQILSDPKGSLKVCGIAAGGSATNDVVTVLNGSAVQVFGGIGNANGSNSLQTIQLASTIRVIGPNVTFTGGTSGQCFIYCPSANY